MKQSATHFTRTRKLPFSRLIALILSLSASHKHTGVDSKVSEIFRSARRSGLWPEALPVQRSGLTRARAKVRWTIFEDLLARAVALAYRLWPRDPKYLWHKMTVIAFDGSWFNLPATDALRKEFDPMSGLDHPGKGHYPQCLVTTAFDVFRRLPIARHIGSIHDSERAQAQALLGSIPSGSVLLFDRGYPSYDLIRYLREHHQGYFLFRCPAESTFPAVEDFVRSRKPEGFIVISPSNKYLKKCRSGDRKHARLIQLRIVRSESPDGSCSVLLTNLLNEQQFSAPEITDLYFRRWEVESHYRDEKVGLAIEKFHGKTPNSIRQEILAAAIMAVIARTLMVISSPAAEPQFKHALITLASEAAVLAPDDPERALLIFSEVLDEIARVKYYRPKSPRPSQPRVSKSPPNRWCAERRKKLEKA